MPLGAPSKYRPEYCEQLVLDMRQGYSIGAFAGKIGVSRLTIDNWRRQFPDFADAVARGLSHRQRQWEEKAMGFGFGEKEKGSATILIFGLRNAGSEDWREGDINVKLSGAVGTYDVAKYANLSLEELTTLERILSRISPENVSPGGGETGDTAPEAISGPNDSGEGT
jgi:transposase-like protein